MKNWYTNMTDLYRGRIVQYAAIFIILIAVVGTMAMFAYQTLFGLPTPSWENTFLVTSITVAANTFGYHQGRQTSLSERNLGVQLSYIRQEEEMEQQREPLFTFSTKPINLLILLSGRMERSFNACILPMERERTVAPTKRITPGGTLSSVVILISICVLSALNIATLVEIIRRL